MIFPLTRSLDRGSTAFLCALGVLAIAIPALNLLLPDTSPLHVPTYLVSLFGKYVCYALLALSIDLIWGYCGILSLGHGAFFALGGYAMGMYLMRQIGTRGVYAHPIRPAESRTRFLGYRVESYKLFVFTLSACMAGIAGALYVPQVGIINPSEFSPANSIEAVIWVAVGGRGTLTGAVLGAVLVNYGKTYFTSGFLAPYWLFLLGGLFIAVTLLLPRGVVGTMHHWWSEWQAG